MKDKKGFTLVELLAVIAILAILVIIALPNVLKMFRDAKVNTFTSEVQNIMRSAESKYVSLSIGNKEIRCFDSSTNVLNLDGRSNILYVVKFNDKGKIVEISARDEANELIANNTNGIQREDIGKKYKVEAAKTSITDCKGNLLIDGEKVVYKESELNGADPVLGSGMIPIMLSDTGVVTYAHEYDEWYKYTAKRWANAVILVDKPSNTNYKAGDTILESDIRGYFVWIPKYSYRIFNIGDYEGLESSQPTSQIREIEIKFGTRTTSEVSGECITPMESGSSRAIAATKDCKVGDLMTHPAFLSIPSNGFWVGKFETGYNQNSDTTQPITDENISTWIKENSEVDEEKPNNIIIKPNVYSWRGAKVYNLFMNAYNFNRSLDSHMMKNTEWGAVAYLSHSKYGINDEVRINNNSNFLTGYAANTKDAITSTTENALWNTDTGKLASTTGNITGVYDMSGGSWEYMASYRDGSDLNVSGMKNIVSNETYTKYLDKYSSSSDKLTYKYRILGDATGEMGPFWSDGSYKNAWYKDYSFFLDSSYSWIDRGGGHSDNVTAGQFRFARSTGDVYFSITSRIVLKN